MVLLPIQRQCACVCPTDITQPETPPFLQLIAFGKNSIEAQEIPLGALIGGSKGKGKAMGWRWQICTVDSHSSARPVFWRRMDISAASPPRSWRPQWDGHIQGHQCSRLGVFILRRSSGGSRLRLECNHGTKHDVRFVLIH